MNQLQKTYANVILQILSLFFLTMYFIFTQGAFPLNYIWFIVAVLLGIVGFSRKMDEAILASLLTGAVYGGLLIYSMYTSSLPVEVTWNDLIWLGVFPYFGLIGGLHKRAAQSYTPIPKKSTLAIIPVRQEHPEDDHNHNHHLDSKLGYSSEEGLITWMHKELPRLVRSGRELTLLSIAIDELDSFQQEYGEEQTVDFIRRIAEMIHYVVGEVEMKALLEDNMFAVVFIGKEQISPKMAQLELTEQFNTLLLTRPRKERNVKVKLLFGTVSSSEHGHNADAVIQQTKQQFKSQLE
ncbi:diguanylate cyclase domain-containing protein [Paenibacillus thalictri]|uniref:diguanylate cyclase domain-containing protein n=1 Tax=Paenibacillus thalictri TaxID=2527873 RepID=UPI0013EEFD5C|nr:GGDEF domain-containing protein [Paenibacillus thalictri]